MQCLLNLSDISPDACHCIQTQVPLPGIRNSAYDVTVHCNKRQTLQFLLVSTQQLGGLVAEWLACSTQAQKGLGSNRSRQRRCRVTVLGKLFTPIVPLFTKQQNW